MVKLTKNKFFEDILNGYGIEAEDVISELATNNVNENIPCLTAILPKNLDNTIPSYVILSLLSYENVENVDINVSPSGNAYIKCYLRIE